MGGAQLIPYCVTFRLLQMAWYESFQGSKHCNPAQIWNRWVPHGANTLLFHINIAWSPSADVWQLSLSSKKCLHFHAGMREYRWWQILPLLTVLALVWRRALDGLVTATAFVNNSRGSSLWCPIPTRTGLKRTLRVKTNFLKFSMVFLCKELICAAKKSPFAGFHHRV